MFGNFIAWGDSLTQGAGAQSDKNFPAILQELSGFKVLNRGINSETSTQIKTRMLADPEYRSLNCIIWAGRNNCYEPDVVIRDIDEMVKSLGHSRYLVLSVINGDYENEKIDAPGYNFIKQLNTSLKETYGDRFLDVREYLIKNSSNSDSDQRDKNNDIVPSSLRSDVVHLNAAGYRCVAQLINDHMSLFVL